MPRLLVVVTMDCERPNEEGQPGVTGPPDWAFSARAMDHYSRLVRAAGWPVSYFCHPEVAHAHPGLLEELRGRGDDVEGLHLHPWKYARCGLRAHFGHLSEGEQRQVLAMARDDWAQAMGRLPQWFRPGTFSASDASFRLAAEAGFKGGSLSVPGRVFPDLGAVWSGCPADPHLAHAHFRICPGELRFANMPLTVDTSVVRQRGIRRWHPDLRPDQAYEDLPGQVERVVRQILERAPAVPVLNLVTHNDHDYAREDEPARRNLVALLDGIRAACDRAGCEVAGATIADVCAAVFDHAPPPPEWVPA